MDRFNPRARVALLFAGLLASSACDLDTREASDEGQYWIRPGIFDLLGGESRQILVGSELRFAVSDVIEGEVDPEQGGIECAYAGASSGVVEALGEDPDVDAYRFRVASPGSGAVEIADPGVSCPANTDILAELGPDRWSVEGVATDEVEARWLPGADGFALADWTEIVDAPEDFGRPQGEVRVFAGSSSSVAPLALAKDASGLAPISLTPVLLRSGAGEGPEAEVRYDFDQVAVESGAEHTQLLSALAPMPADTVIEPVLSFSGEPLSLPPLRAVELDAIAELELVAVHERVVDETRSRGRPEKVLAVVRDAEGRRVVGAPVEWTLTRGELALFTGESGVTDSLELADICSRPPQEPREDRAAVEARVGELVASVDLEWTSLPTDNRRYDAPECVDAGACNCSTGGDPRRGALALVALLGLGLGLRRRRRR